MLGPIAMSGCRRFMSSSKIILRSVHDSAIASQTPPPPAAAAAPPLLPLPIPDEEVTALQHMLRYDFKDRRPLEEALIHTSYPSRGLSSLAVPRSPRSYELLKPAGEFNLKRRMELHMYLTANLKRDEPQELFRINHSPHKLARTAVHLGLYNSLRRASPKLDQEVTAFIDQQSGSLPFLGSLIKVPPVLIHLVQALFAAITLDRDDNDAAAWKVMGYHFLPIVYGELLEDAVTTLSDLCTRNHMVLDFKTRKVCNLTNKSVFINGNLYGFGTSIVEAKAESIAAMDALNKLPSCMLTGTVLDFPVLRRNGDNTLDDLSTLKC